MYVAIADFLFLPRKLWYIQLFLSTGVGSLGKEALVSYWANVLLYFLCANPANPAVQGGDKNRMQGSHSDFVQPGMKAWFLHF
jgi:hypothetical protein